MAGNVALRKPSRSQALVERFLGSNHIRRWTVGWVEPAEPAHRAGSAGDTHHRRRGQIRAMMGFAKELNPSYGPVSRKRSTRRSIPRPGIRMMGRASGDD